MTDTLYPSHPNLTEGQAGFNPYQAAILNNPASQQAYLQQGYPQQPYPMPHLPQSFHPMQRQDVDVPMGQPMPAQAFDNGLVENNVSEAQATLLQDVTWPNSSVSPDVSIEVMPELSPTPAPSLGLSAAYPPMPSMQAAPIPTIMPSYDTPPIGAPNAAEDNAAQVPKNLMSSVRRRLSSLPQPKKPKTLPKIIAEKANTEIVSDPAKPRSSRSIFLVGLLSGAVVTYVLITSFSLLTSHKQQAIVDSVKPVNQVEKLNDDLLATPRVGNSTSQGVAANDEGDESFLDEQLSGTE